MGRAEQSGSLLPGAVRAQGLIAGFTATAIGLHLLWRFGLKNASEFRGLPLYDLPLLAALAFGGIPQLIELSAKLLRGQFSSDLLAGLSIVTSVLLGEYLAGSLVVLMLSGGEALEAYAVRRASSVLEALAKRMPSQGHRKTDGNIVEVPLEEVAVGDTLVVFPYEICPVDGTVLTGHSVMDESYLTGEPYLMSKTPGSAVLSGAINGDVALTIRADVTVKC
jgi:cation transport ATPase